MTLLPRAISPFLVQASPVYRSARTNREDVPAPNRPVRDACNTGTAPSKAASGNRTSRQVRNQGPGPGPQDSCSVRRKRRPRAATGRSGTAIGSVISIGAARYRLVTATELYFPAFASPPALGGRRPPSQGESADRWRCGCGRSPRTRRVPQRASTRSVRCSRCVIADG